MNERDLLFGVLAVQLQFVTVETLAEHLIGADVLADRLQRVGALTQRRRRTVERAVEDHLAAHAGDVEGTLCSLRVEPAVRQQSEHDAPASMRQTLSLLPIAAASPVSAPAAATTEAYADPAVRGRYRILRHHADGGLGTVSVALDTELRREVALKEILPQHRAHAAAAERFVREAEVTGHLEQPGIVPVYGLGVVDDQPYYAMRFIRGQSLKDATDDFHRRDFPSAADRNLAFRELLGRFTDVCDAVQYAHSRGVIHRDLKPENVMLGKYGETLVVDWGLAKPLGTADPQTTGMPIADGSGTAQTQAGSAIGTPTYMSPEQADGRLDLLTAATDVYALGAVLAHLVSGRLPVIGETKDETLAKVRRGDTLVAGPCPEGTPKALWSVCRRAMSRDIAARYPTAAEVAAEVQRHLADEPVHAHREPSVVRVRRWLRRHPAGLATALLLGFLAAVVIAVVVSGFSRELAGRTGKLKESVRPEQALSVQAEKDRAAARRAELHPEFNLLAALLALDGTADRIVDDS